MKKLIILVLFAIIYYGCGSSQKDLTKTSEGDIPKWYLNPPKDVNYLYAVNTCRYSKVYPD